MKTEAMRYLGSEADAEDVVSEAVIKLLAKGFSPEDLF